MSQLSPAAFNHSLIESLLNQSPDYWSVRRAGMFCRSTGIARLQSCTILRARMADILDFRSTVGKSPKRTRSDLDSSRCEVVIFPGIRYERWENSSAQQSATRARKSVKRDTLELTD